MKNIILMVFFLIGIFQFSIGQKSTFIGFEGAVTSDIYNIHDPCSLIEPALLLRTSWGITIGQELSKNFLIETGLIRKYYDEGFDFTTGTVALGTISNAFRSWQIPLRLKAKINLIKNRFFLTTTVGFHYCINSEYAYGGGSGGASFIDGNDTIIVNYTINDSITKTFPLIEAGLGFEFEVYNGLLIYLSSSYYSGLKKVYQLDLKTEGYGCATDNATAVSKGSYWNIAFGIKYAISNLWRKKE